MGKPLRVWVLAGMMGVPSKVVLENARLVGRQWKSPSSKVVMLPTELEAFKAYFKNVSF